MIKIASALALLISAYSSCDAFFHPTTTTTTTTTFARSAPSSMMRQAHQNDSFESEDTMENNIHMNNNNHNNHNDSTRRKFFLTNLATQASLLTATTLSLSPLTANANANANTLSSTPKGPIVVIGSNGKTGTECVKALTKLSLPVRATSRSGIYTDAASLSNNHIPPTHLYETAVCDVTQSNTITAALKGASAVIFAASASKQGGTPAQVDNDGLVSVAKACIDANIPKLVIVSSGAVTKPSSPVFLFLNLFGKIMEEKIKGEDMVRALYQTANRNSDSDSDSDTPNLSYTVIRPGGLTEEEPLGVAALELNQGDSKSGRIARADVAQLCIQSILFPGLTENVTFECYNKDTGAPLATVGVSNIMKKKTASETFVSGRECVGSSWEEMFQGLERDSY